MKCLRAAVLIHAAHSDAATAIAFFRAFGVFRGKKCSKVVRLVAIVAVEMPIS